MTAPRAETPPSPDGGWSTAIEMLDDAVVVPAAESLFVQPAGVLREDGSHCDIGAFWRNHRPLSVAPEPPPGTERLKGRWLWGGVLWVHFGHFLVESCGRLWALDARQLAEDPPDGIIFVPKRPARETETASFQEAFWKLCGIDMPVRVLTTPTTVETLCVPGQGFGLGQIIRGTVPFRDYMASHFGAGVAPDGPERLYVSRSKLGLNKGGLVGETALEAYLAAEGYEIFHPQEHDMATQVARYKAATHLVAAEGSALHLFGFVGRPDQRVAIVVRRHSGATDMIAEHLRSFCSIAPLLVEELQNVYALKGGHKKRHDLGVLHLPRVEAALAEGGFVSGGKGWEQLRWRDVKKVIGDRYEKRGAK